MKQLKRPMRRTLLTLHVIVSVSWLGLALGLLALGIAAYTAEDPATTQAAYRAMQIVADWLIIPLALLAFLSGVLLSLGTPWGLARHHWVRIKFWLTLVTLSATVFALRPNIHQAAADGQPDLSLVAAPVVSATAYLFMTAISVLKPWGLTRRGRRLRVLATSRKTVDERSPAPTA